MSFDNSEVSFLWTDGKPLQWQGALQYGRSSLVLEYSTSVLKIPRISGPPSLPLSTIQSQLTYEDIENEKEVYRRLEGCPGVVKCLRTTPMGIELERMKQGSLERYVENHREQPLSLDTRLQLSLSAAEGLHAIHRRWVLPFDVHLRNLLLTDDLRSVRYCDFADSVILPFETALPTVIREGVSMQMDIFRLGSVLYAIMAWTTTAPDLIFPKAPNQPGEDSGTDGHECTSLLARWPDDLPDTSNLLFLGEQIRKCWTQNSYRDSAEVYDKVQSAAKAGVSLRSD